MTTIPLMQVMGKDGQIIAIDPTKVTAVESYRVHDAIRDTDHTYSKIFVAGQHVFISTAPTAALVAELNELRTADMYDNGEVA